MKKIVFAILGLFMLSAPTIKAEPDIRDLLGNLAGGSSSSDNSTGSALGDALGGLISGLLGGGQLSEAFAAM